MNVDSPLILKLGSFGLVLTLHLFAQGRTQAYEPAALWVHIDRSWVSTGQRDPQLAQTERRSHLDLHQRRNRSFQLVLCEAGVIFQAKLNERVSNPMKRLKSNTASCV